MMKYDKSKPLINLHIPKCAGRSFQAVMREWFGRNLETHYYGESKQRMPKKIRIKKLFSDQYRPGLCIYGHFNNDRGFGVKDYYPNIDQFITVVRDPLEAAASSYYYCRKVGAKLPDQSRIPQEDINTHLKTAKSDILSHLPFDFTLENYEDILGNKFIHVGLTEELDASIVAIAHKLGFDPIKVETLNQTKRDQSILEETKKIFIDKHPLEYAIYEFAKQNFSKID